MTRAHLVYGPYMTTDTSEEFMDRFARSQRSSIGMIETDGLTFQLLAEPGVRFRVCDEIGGWAVRELVENGVPR